MSLAKKSFSSKSGATAVAVAGGTDTGIRVGAGSKQALLEGVGLTAIDSDRRLRCLSRNPALKFEVISYSSSFSSQIMGDTTQLTLIFGSLLEVEEDEDDEENEADGEDGDAGGGVLAF